MKKNIISIVMVLITFIACLCFSSSIIETSIYIVSFFYDYMFPSLIPMLISLFILLDTGVLYYLAYFLQYITLPLFKLNGYGALCILLAILTGFPFSTIFITKLYKENKLTKEEVYTLVCSLTIPSFSFIFTTIKNKISLNSFHIILLCLYGSSLILLFILSRFLIKKSSFIYFKDIHLDVSKYIKNFSFSRSLKNNIITITDSLTIILGTMVYFSVLTIFIKSIFHISNTMEGLIEFSFISVQEASLNHLKSVIIILSFSSLSCLFQCSYILEENGLKTIPLTLSKCLHPLLSICLFYIKKL